MLTPQDLTLYHPAFAPLPHSAPQEESSLISHFACLSSDVLLAAPIDKDEEDEEDDPEDAEDDLDEEEEEDEDEDPDERPTRGRRRR